MEEGERVVKGQHPDEEEEEEDRERERGANQQNQQEIQEIWSWGAGTEGQLGTGRLQDEHPPQLLIGLSNSLSLFGSISLLACGGAHVIALTSSKIFRQPFSPLSFSIYRNFQLILHWLN